MYLLTSNTESCDEDDEEVGVGVVEELADKTKKLLMVHSSIYCNRFTCHF